MIANLSVFIQEEVSNISCGSRTSRSKAIDIQGIYIRIIIVVTMENLVISDAIIISSLGMSACHNKIDYPKTVWTGLYSTIAKKIYISHAYVLSPL